MKFNITKYRSNQLKGLECLNCGQPLTGSENFCSNCGQKNTSSKLTFNNFINSLISGFFSYDSRFWNTFVPLLIHPGKVSKQYIEGKRTRFVNPFQLYLNVSIIFFLIVGISNKFSSDSTVGNDLFKTNISLDSLSQNQKSFIDSVSAKANEEVLKFKKLDSSKVQITTDWKTAMDIKKSLDSNLVGKKYEYNIKKSQADRIGWTKKIADFHNFYNENPSYSSLNAIGILGYEKTFWNKLWYQLTMNANKNFEKYKEEGANEFFKTMTSYISISLFVFLPIFTLFLWLVYIRHKFTYVEHLVFVFHVQTVFFLLFSIFYLLNLTTDSNTYLVVFALIFTYYLYKAMRYFYMQRRMKTIVKFVVINMVYLAIAIIGFIITAALSVVVG